MDKAEAAHRQRKDVHRVHRLGIVVILFYFL
jgi:hypothetical protein